jgi:hypothetical protein
VIDKSLTLFFTADGTLEWKESARTPLPAIRCNTPQQLATRERELQESLHNYRMDVVLARRQLLALEKKSNVIEQRIRKEKKFTDNKNQVLESGDGSVRVQVA